MTWVNIPGYWAEPFPYRARGDLDSGTLAMLVQTSLNMDALNESVQLCGRVALSNKAASVAFDTNSRIIFRTGTGNIFTEATTVLRVGIQDVSVSTGPPLRGDGTFDVYGDIPSGTYTDIADSTTYAVPMTSGSKTISHGDLISIKFELTSFTASDAVRLQSFRNTASSSAGYSQNVCLLNTVGTVTSPCPLILDFEGDNSVLGIIDMGHPHVEIQDTIVAVSSGNEDGMMVEFPVAVKVDGFYIATRITDGVNAELYYYTAPTGTPSGTLLATLDGDAQFADETVNCWQTHFAPIEIPAATPVAFILKSGGSSLRVSPMSYRNMNDVRFFSGAGASDIRVTRTGGSGAFSSSSGKQHLFGLHVCAIDIPAGGGGSGGLFPIF